MYPNVLRRQGYRLVGGALLTRHEVRRVFQDENAFSGLVNQVIIVGPDVPSTDMQMSQESKKLSCAVKHLSWKPPWVLSEEGEEENPAARYLGKNAAVPDRVGLGRQSNFWWTFNCGYN